MSYTVGFFTELHALEPKLTGEFTQIAMSPDHMNFISTDGTLHIATKCEQGNWHFSGYTFAKIGIKAT